MDAFLALPIVAIFVASALLLAAACELGHFLGLRAKGEASISTLEGSVLGLLALMLGFSFAMAVTRFDARRDALVQEANAIGTAALRASLLPPPFAPDSLRLLQSYAHIRRDVARNAPASGDLDGVVTRSNELQTALWRQARGAAAKDNAMVPTGLYLQALNDMFDAQEKRVVAFATRVPAIVIVGLYGIALVAIGFPAYAAGLERRRWRLPVYVAAILVAGVIVLIQDIDRPGVGFVNVDQKPLVDVAASVDRLLGETARAEPARGR